ncbi:Clan CA, family C19, ubiquitin hydrolase-like cysteine peptidase [Tritrichomonas foetus]|uniref:Clan CA, family C19, ubiquitin hydrolase-like cysteine peptidase n=1 Tax=Tritrichomonas foetus TaxID=1144522 RepID=A0A1J4KLJ4_9EUKA|nr:Clan CA, family C19, ubiquitin hydrolase-like cysteine peptidase [Tritrichomonas foetus]|eukprot:OHT12169.1 Clan CA, family C19, ubiquitin hydrolase-like cysteine peptidase [Tritrichomonas foetus]
MNESVNDADITAAISNVNQELLPRRINFVPAKFEYKMQVNDSIIFVKNTEHYSINYGGSGKSQTKARASIFDPKKLAQIKTWSTRYKIGNGYEDNAKRGFAVSVLYALRACPSFRQYSNFHKESCKRVGCTLCKIYRFFDEVESHQNINFPLDLNVFDRKWTLGSPGDSAEFFNQLMNVLQSEEIGSTRAFQSISEYTSAIGQIFHIESVNKIVCKECGRSIPVKDSYWTLFSPNKIEKCINQKNKTPVDDYSCDACGKETYCIEEFTELPLILTIQFNNWADNFQFRKKQFQASKYLKIKVGDVNYRLCALTSYDGVSSEGGKFSTAFLSSSGTWNSMVKGKISPIDINTLSNFQPQLLFFTRDEPNAKTEQSSLVRILPDTKNSNKYNLDDDLNQIEEEEENDDDGDNMKNRMKAAVDSITQSIQKQLKKNMPNKDENNRDAEEVIVVDTTNREKRKIDRNSIKGKLKTVKNPLEKLLKSRNVHETATWDGVEAETDRKEISQGWKEEAPDEWDQSLDKGHQRKIRNKRQPPAENPFDKVPTKRNPNDFKGREERNKIFGGRKSNDKKFGDRKFGGNRKFGDRKFQKDKFRKNNQ